MDISDAQTSGTLSRLERGLEIAKETAAAVSGARFAAAIGRGRGYLSVPLTWDSETVLNFLETLDGSSMTGRSTNLEALLDAAADAFQSSSPAKKIIVFISDGESLNGVIKNAVNRCAKEGIIINAVAIGSDEGRAVPFDAQTDDALASGLIDTLASNEISRRDAAVMRNAAEKTGGIYIDGSRDDAASVLSVHLFSLAQEKKAGNSPLAAQTTTAPKERRTLFIILSIIAFGVSKFVPFFPIGRSRNKRRQQTAPFVSLAVMLFVFTSCSEGKLLMVEANYLHSRGRYDEALVSYFKALDYDDSSPYAEYGLGLTFYLIGEGGTALRHFENSQKKLEMFDAAEHRELRYRNCYNSGIVFFEEGDYRSAAAAFKAALREDPRKTDAKRNLELSLMSMVRQTDDDSGEKKQVTAPREILFEYIRQEEQQVWKSREWMPEENFTGADY